MQPTQQNDQTSPAEFFRQANQLLSVGDVFEASKRAGKLRIHFPEEPPVLALHGTILAKLGIHRQAIADMRAAAKLTLAALDDGDGEDEARPRIVDQYLRLQAGIGTSLMALGEYEEAGVEIDRALEMDPDRADAICAKAELLAATGQIEGAFELLDEALKFKLDEVPLLVSLVRILGTMEKTDAARLKESQKRLGELCVEVGLAPRELVDALRAHGQVCDMLGEYAEAFGSFRRAAKLRRGEFNAKAHAMMVSKLIENWTVDGIASLTRPGGSLGSKRILLGGTNQSGMSEVSALLDLLPGVALVGPVETLGALCASKFNAANGVLRALVPTPVGHRGDQIQKLADLYSQQSDAAAGQGGQWTVDSHPHNLPLMGCAATALDGVVIINCRRDPIEESLAIYCDGMVGNHPYAGDLISTASYVKDNGRLMDHWTSVLNDERVGAKVINVQYEQVLSDPASVLRQLGEAMGIEVGDDLIADLAADLEPSKAAGPGANVSEYGIAMKQLREFFGD